MRRQRFPSLCLRWIDIFQHGLYPDVTVGFIPYSLAKTVESPIKQNISRCLGKLPQNKHFVIFFQAALWPRVLSLTLS
ncbi:hypothetical protein F0252_17205 [Vibrio hepatarius]|nr:hypothetical protein [Vibrio hepatarius]